MHRCRLLLSALAGTLPPARAQAAPAAGTLREATTMAEIPPATGQAGHGAEGQRLIGRTLYDGPINWDLPAAGHAAQLTPGLAPEWAVDPQDRTRWTSRLTPDLRFHDGPPLTAADIARNFDKLLKREAPQYDQQQATQAATYVASPASWRALEEAADAPRTAAALEAASPWPARHPTLTSEEIPA